MQLSLFHHELCISLFQSALKQIILSSCNNQCGLHKKPAEIEFIIVSSALSPLKPLSHLRFKSLGTRTCPTNS